MEAFRIDKIIDCHSLLLGFAMEVFKKFAREGAFAFLQMHITIFLLFVVIKFFY